MQVPLDRARTEEQLGTDLRVGEPVAGEPGDLLLLRREILARLERTLAQLRTGGDQLALGALGERLHPDLGEHLLGGPQPLARLAGTTVAAQPLAEDQMCTGELNARIPAQSVDRLVISGFGIVALAEQRPTARLDAEREAGAGGLRRRGEPIERIPATVVSPTRAEASMSSNSAHIVSKGKMPCVDLVAGSRAHPRSGRGRCRAPRRPSRQPSPRFPGRVLCPPG